MLPLSVALIFHSPALSSSSHSNFSSSALEWWARGTSFSLFFNFLTNTLPTKTTTITKAMPAMTMRAIYISVRMNSSMDLRMMVAERALMGLLDVTTIL